MEEAERLEQLRALWIDMRIQVAIATEPMEPGVDSAEDLDRVRTLFSTQRLEKRPKTVADKGSVFIDK